jgi:autotransporter strand-loop-strand O-heptosyltransferase
MKPKIFAHGSYIGTTGYNHHTRDFFRELSKFCDIKVRNFTIGSTWSGYNKTPHNNEPYINDIDKKILYKQILFDNDRTRGDYDIYPDSSKDFIHDLNIILCETDHYIFYDNYNGPKIAYNVWESTLQPDGFFKKLLEYDELWVPSKWQRDCTIKQGYNPEKIKVIPEGVDVDIFFPENVTHPVTNNCFSFFLAGRWDYRKSTKEIIETFIKTFKHIDDVKLILSVDNPFSNDGLNSTEERLKFYGLEDPKIEILHFPSREDYVKILKSCNVFLSCARSEGWNLPLIESMACGIPSIYSNCSGQLEFAEGKGIPVNIIGELPVSNSSYNHFNTSVGNYYEPDFEDLSVKMLDTYKNYPNLKKLSLEESGLIRKEFNWETVSEKAYKTIHEFLNKKSWLNKPIEKNQVFISYLDGPKVEISGDEYEKYFIEFLDEKNNVVHSSTITNNMWTSCGRKYYTNWTIRINGNIVDQFNLENKRVLISLESKSIGDTIAWAPYAVAFAEKHKCKVILSTFHNDWFKGLESYKNIEFINPGRSTNCFALYRIGWFRDDNGGWKKYELYPNQLNLIPLQKTATDILGLNFYELNLGVNYKPSKRKILEKYVVIGPQSTSGCKEWPYENWQKLTQMIKNTGYKVVSLTNKPFQINGVKNFSNSDWQTVFNILYNAEIFIGLASGLSWINWALNKKTIMIAGFSENGHEFTKNLIRVSKNVCIKCWNDPVFIFDSGDWDWCPVYKGTERQHICQKSITPLDVYLSLPIELNMDNVTEFNWGPSSDWYRNTITTEIFKNKIYEKFFEVSKNDIVVDFGSSIGPFAYSISDRKIKHIYCLEPSKDFIKTLEENTSKLPCTIINKGIGKNDGQDNFNLFGETNEFSESESITFKSFIENYNIKSIDFLKTDCEGGEYLIFTNENLDWIKNNVRKISGEWHLSTPELKEKFRNFRDNFLNKFKNYQIMSVDNIDIKWDLNNEHFIEYYSEVIVYIDNR